MKKKQMLYILALICSISFGLTACGRETEDAVSQEETADDSKEDIAEGELQEGELQEKESEPASEPAVSENTTEPAKERTGIQPLHLMTGNQYDSYYSEAYACVTARVEYPVIQLESCCSEEYPGLARALTDLNTRKKETLLEEYNYMIEQSVIQLQEMGQEYFQPYETTESAIIRRADSNIVSILMECYYYGGGVHGTPYDVGYTYDVKNGQQLSLADIVSDVSVLPQYVQTELNKYYEPEIFFEGYDLNDYFTEYQDSISWVLDYNGLTIIFNPYEIAPYASGSQTVTLSFTEYPDLVRAQYQQVPESYGVSIPEYDSFYYDVDGDGQKDELSVFGVVSEYDQIEKHAILIDDRRFEVESYAYDIDPLLIHMKDGCNYLYIQDTIENDYRILNLYKFTPDGAVESLGVMNNAGWYGQMMDNNDMVYLEQVLTDPLQFRLEGRTDVLSTLTGYKNYQISASGTPVSEDNWYTHTSSLYLTLLQPLDVDIIDEKTGAKTGTATLAVGTKVLYYRTDDATFADLKLTDGTVARVLVKADTWPCTVNGVDTELIFEGMMFAG